LRSDVTHMENIAITHKENTFHIEGFPDAVKVLP
jgi:hypothetical protein